MTVKPIVERGKGNKAPGKKKGTPKTGGRGKGVKNKETRYRESVLAEGGLSPLEYIISVLHSEDSSDDDKKWAAVAAAPYVHPRLQAVTHSGSLHITHEDALKELA